MTILNYFFTGFAFTFLCDLLMNLKLIQNHPKMKNHTWGWNERIILILIWPLGLLVFLGAFIKNYKK